MFEFSQVERNKLAARVSPVPEAGCWLWTGGLSRKGYGHFYLRGRIHRAHRVSFEMAKGPIPAGLGVCHKCDTPSCVNPDHLFLGDQRANILDAVAKGRVTTDAANSIPRACRKLTDEQAAEILGSTERHYVLAAKFGINASTIRRIRNRTTYQWVQAVAA